MAAWLAVCWPRAKKLTPSECGPPSIFTSLKNGMQQLPDAILAQLSADNLHPNSLVQAVQRQDQGLGSFRRIYVRPF